MRSKRVLYLFAILLAVLLLRVLLFEFYRVSSSSMEKTISSGRLILVNKFLYGTRLPMKPKEIPFFGVFAYVLGLDHWADNTHWKYVRIPKLSSIELDDILVFDEINGDKQVLKRCVGLPGDTIFIRNNNRFCNGKLQKEVASVMFSFKVVVDSNVKFDNLLSESGLGTENILWQKANEYHVSMTKEQANGLKKVNGIEQLHIDDAAIGAYGPDLFPSRGLGYTRENYGPVVIPKKGTTVALTVENISLYRKIIVDQEGNRFSFSNGKIFINNFLSSSYRFKMDYYFVMGDNRYHSKDSRYWGFLPESRIIGKAVLF